MPCGIMLYCVFYPKWDNNLLYELQAEDLKLAIINFLINLHRIGLSFETSGVAPI